MADYPVFTAPTRAAMTADQARNQAGGELQALYARAMQNVKSQLYNNQVNAAEQAAARGLSHSGLAQDAQNKLSIAAQGQIADMEAERASKVAALARQILERDQDVGFRERQQSYNEWNGQQGLRMQRDQFDYQKSHDREQLDYQKSRDSVKDGQWQQEFSLQKQRAASSGGSGRGGGSSRGGSGRSSGRSSGGSSGGSSQNSLSGYTRDQIAWYSNPNNAPYNYGQKKPTPVDPMKPIYNPPAQSQSLPGFTNLAGQYALSRR